MVKTLLEAGADPTATGRKGDTALMRAKEMSCAKCVEMIQAALNKRNGTQN
jgi:ankyrin repeat protein